MYGYVYLTTDLRNNKIYVGQHKSDSFDEKYYGSGRIIKSIINNYGTDILKCEILQECFSFEELNEAEIYWIDVKDARNPDVGYNIASGGTFGDSGYHLGMLGKQQSDKQKEAAREYQLNNPKSDETREKMRKSAHNRPKDCNKGQGKGMKHVWKGDITHKVKPEEVDKYLAEGYQLGKSPKVCASYSKHAKNKYANGTYVSKNGIVKHVPYTELNQYLEDGWVVGKKWNK